MSGRRLVARSKWETEAERDESCLELTQPRDWMRDSRINQSGLARSVCRDQRDGARPGAFVPLCLPSPLSRSITAATEKKERKKKKRKRYLGEKALKRNHFFSLSNGSGV